MLLNTKFFRNAENGNGAGGTENKAEIPAEVLQELEALRRENAEFKNKPIPKTPEEEAQEREIEEADFRKFSVENKLLKNDDFTSYESLKARQDSDLVFDGFSKEFKETNPESTDEEVREAFEQQYHINSENPVLKARGEKALARDAKDIRSELENSISKARADYQEVRKMSAEVPGYNQFIDQVIKDAIPEKLISKLKDGEDDIEIDVELTDDQRKEIEKIFKNEKTFHSYLKNKDKRDELKAQVAKKVDGFLKQNNYDRAVQRGYEIGKGRGTDEGSEVGAREPFAKVKSELKTKEGPSGLTLEASNEKIARARRERANR